MVGPKAKTLIRDVTRSKEPSDKFGVRAKCEKYKKWPSKLSK